MSTPMYRAIYRTIAAYISRQSSAIDVSMSIAQQGTLYLESRHTYRDHKLVLQAMDSLALY